MKFKNVIGTITIDGSFLQSANLQELEDLASLQTELGRVLSKVLVSNKMGPGIDIYTMRDEDGGNKITVSYIHD